MSVALTEIANWIEDFTSNNFNFVIDGIPRLTIIEQTLKHDFELTRYSQGQLADLFDELIDEAHDEIEVCGICFQPSDVLKTDPIAYRQCFLEYQDNEFVEHGQWSYNIQDMMMASPSIVQDAQVAFEDAVLASLDEESDEKILLDSLTGTSEFIPRFRAIWEARVFGKALAGKGVDRPFVRLM